MRKGLLAVALLAALPASAARRGEDALSLVPPDSASVGVIRLADLRTNPLSAQLFDETDKITIDGDAARFMAETRLSPKEDVDLVVVAGSPGRTASGSSVLVMFEGRFDPARLAAAMETRGMPRKTTASGDYFLLKDRDDKQARRHDGDGAVAFPAPHLVIAGSEAAVREALARRAEGGTRFLSGAGIGRHLSRVNTGASAWALVDVARLPKPKAGVKIEGDVNGTPVAAIAGAMGNVSLLAFQANVAGDALKLSATGLSDDQETLELLEDTLRGILAAVRLGAQEKSPEVVPVLRKFKVSRDDDSIALTGTLPGEAVRALAKRAHEEKAERHAHHD
jgi:hypothetical protein